jgi:hypothetical protein
MATFKLFEKPAPGNPPGDQKKVPANTPLARGDQILIINRVLVDKKGKQRGTFVLRGTIVEVSGSDVLMSFEGNNNIFKKGAIIFRAWSGLASSLPASPSPLSAGPASLGRLMAR